MNEGRYIYCILEGNVNHSFGKIGIMDRDTYATGYEGISAVVSSVPLEEIRPSVEKIAAHQRVVEASRNVGTTLPVRFGVIFKTEQGIRKLLTKRMNEYRTKLRKFREKDEFGVKVILEDGGLKRLQGMVQSDSEILKKMREEISCVTDGAGYFLKMKADEIMKFETFKRIEGLASELHSQLAKFTDDNCMLKLEHKNVILNAAYLINSKDIDIFNAEFNKLKKKYGPKGLVFHISGPWAPYSFC